MKVIKGDIFRGKEDVLIHGRNCFCTMGADIALQVLKIYPGAYYEADLFTKTWNIFCVDRKTFLL